MIPTGEPIAGHRADDVVDGEDQTMSDLFAWLCRLVDGDDAVRLLPDVYTEAAIDGVGAADRDRLLAIAYALATDQRSPSARHDLGVVSSVDGDVADPAEVVPDAAEMSVLDRALVELRSVQGRDDGDIAAIVDRPAADIAGLVAAAEQRARIQYPEDTFASIGTQRETWLDDSTRARCRAAIAAPPTTSRSRPPSGARRERVPRSSTIRPTPVLLGLGLVAMVIAAVVWVQSGETPTHHPAADQAVGDTVPALTEDPGYVLGDAGRGFAAVGAAATDATPQGGSAPGQLQIWATRDAGRTTGRWFAIVTARCTPFDTTPSAVGTRIDVNGRPGLMTTEGDGVIDLRVQSGTNDLTTHVLSMKAFGLSSEAIAKIAASVLLGNRVKDPTELATPSCTASQSAETIEFDSTFDSLHRGMTRVVKMPWFAGPTISVDGDGAAERIVEYHDPDLGHSLTVTTRPSSAAHPLLVRFLQMATTDPLGPLNAHRRLQVRDRSVTVSAVLDPSGLLISNVLEWEADDNSAVQIVSPLNLGALTPLVRSLRPASKPEWLDLRAYADAVVTPTSPTSTTLPLSAAPLYPAGSSSTASGITWQLLVGVDPPALQLEVPSLGSVFQEPFDPSSNLPLHVYLTVDSTIAVVCEDDPPAGLSMQIVLDTGAAQQPVPLQTATGSLACAIAAFDDVGPFTVQMIDASGTIVRTFSAKG